MKNNSEIKPVLPFLSKQNLKNIPRLVCIANKNLISLTSLILICYSAFVKRKKQQKTNLHYAIT